ncbi:MAG: hypothetical protein ABFQ95_08350 [Pseudomonadota bacterium]
MKKLLSTVSLMALVSAPSFGSLADLVKEADQKITQSQCNKLLLQYENTKANVTTLLENTYLNPIRNDVEQTTNSNFLDLDGSFANLSLEEKIARLKTSICQLEKNTGDLIDLIQKYKVLAGDDNESANQGQLKKIIEILNVKSESFTPSEADENVGHVLATVKYEDQTSNSDIRLKVLQNIHNKVATLRQELWCLHEQSKLSKWKKKNERTLQRVSILQDTQTTIYTLEGTTISCQSETTGIDYPQRAGNQYTSCSENSPFSCHHGHQF